MNETNHRRTVPIMQEGDVFLNGLGAIVFRVYILDVKGSTTVFCTLTTITLT